MTEPINRQWRLAARPEGLIEDSDFEWLEEPVRPLEDGEILARNIYLSLDPANRGWVNKGPSYVEPVEIGDIMRFADEVFAPERAAIAIIGPVQPKVIGGIKLDKLRPRSRKR